MATEKGVATNTAVPAKKIVATKAPASAKGPVQKMTKTQRVGYMAEQTATLPKQVAAFLNFMIETATTQTRKNGEFTVPGLGKLVKAQCATRMGGNPVTGETIKLAAKTTVKFRLAKSAKDAVVPSKP